MYLLLIPVVLSGLVSPVFSLMVKIDCQSIYKKTNSSFRPILYLDHHISNQNHFEFIRRRKKRKRGYKKPSLLYHLTMRGRIYIGTKLLLLAIRERYDQAISDTRRNLHTQYINFWDGFRQVSKNISSLLAMGKKFDRITFWATRNICMLHKNFRQYFQYVSKIAFVPKTLYHNMRISNN